MQNFKNPALSFCMETWNEHSEIHENLDFFSFQNVLNCKKNLCLPEKQSGKSYRKQRNHTMILVNLFIYPKQFGSNLNTIAIAFSICTTGLSTNRACEVILPRAVLPVEIENTVIIVFIARICLKLTKEKLNCLNSSEIRMEKSWKWKATLLCNNGFTLSEPDVTLQMAA